MKKIFMTATVAIFTLVLMLPMGSHFSHAAEQKAKAVLTEKETMIRDGEKLIETGKWIEEEGKKTKDQTMIKNGQTMIKQGQMMKEGKKIDAIR